MALAKILEQQVSPIWATDHQGGICTHFRNFNEQLFAGASSLACPLIFLLHVEDKNVQDSKILTFQ